MQAFEGVGARRGLGEGLIELLQVAQLDHEMKLAQAVGRETELPPHQPPAHDLARVAQMAEIGRESLAEGEIARARLQIEPDMIDVQRAAPAAARGPCRAGIPLSTMGESAPASGSQIAYARPSFFPSPPPGERAG